MKAFTLVEILISTFIFSLILSGILTVLYVGDMAWRSDLGLLDLQQQARQAMYGMIREIRQSRRADIIISNGGQAIQFIIPAEIFNSHTTYNDDISYYFDNNQLIREHPAATTAVLAHDINNLNFCFWDGNDCCDPSIEDCSGLNVLQVSLGAEKIVKQRVLSFSLTEKARLRNE